MSSLAMGITEISLWKKIGNECFVSGSYINAAKWYTKCVEFPVLECPERIDALSNRAASYLKLTWFSLALKDTEEVLKQDPGHVKAIFRKSKSLCGLNKPGEALRFLKSQLSRYNEDNESKEVLMSEINTVDSIKDQVNGIYDMRKLTEQKDEEKRLENMMEFTGPMKIAPVPGKGRGMVATRNISAGELILTSRACMIAFRNPDDEVVKRNELVNLLCHRLEVDSECRKDLFNLYAGSELGYLDEEEAMRTSANSCERVGEIIIHNSFQGGVLSNKDKHSSGLWILPSYINHSCIDCNCLWADYGDFLFIRAFKNIAKGEEILVPYISPMNSFEERRTVLGSIGFACSCSLCIYAQSQSPETTAKIAKIMRKMEKVKEKYELDDVDGEWLQKSVTRINKLSPKTSCNFELVHFYEHLGLYYLDRDVTKAIDFCEKGFSLTNTNALSPAAVDFAFNIVLINLIKGGRQNIKVAKKWAARMKENLMLSYGSIDILRARGGTRPGQNFLHLLKQNGIAL